MAVRRYDIPQSEIDAEGNVSVEFIKTSLASWFGIDPAGITIGEDGTWLVSGYFGADGPQLYVYTIEEDDDADLQDHDRSGKPRQ